MAICKYCGVAFSWGNLGGKWVPLIPEGEEDGVPREYATSDGVLRSGHRAICINLGGPAVHISKLAVPVMAGETIHQPKPRKEVKPKHPMWRKKK